MGNQVRSLDYCPFPKHWGPGCQMISISMPASERMRWVWTGFGKIQLWCTAVWWNKCKIQKIYGCVTFLRLRFPSKNYFWSSICAEFLCQHQVLLLWPSWQSADEEVEQNVWRATQLMVLGESCQIMCLLGHGSYVNGFQIFLCKFASRFLQTPTLFQEISLPGCFNLTQVL